MASTAKLPRLTRPMTTQEERILRKILKRWDHCAGLARVNLDGEGPRQGWHAARAARYLRSAVREVSHLLHELAPIVAAEEARQRKPLTSQERGRVDAAIRVRRAAGSRG